MPRKESKFNTVSFDWMIPVEERQQVESLLSSLGYRVDGGGTNLESHTSEIFLRPKARSHKRRMPKGGEVAS